MISWLVILLVIVPFIAFGQKGSIDAKLQSVDSIELNIIKVSPDEFPKVSVVFEAIKNGYPIFDLQIDRILVSENGISCPVTSLTGISEKYNFNFSLVVDHSGSMAFDFKQMSDPGIRNWVEKVSYDTVSGKFVINNYPENYAPPIEYAKNAVLEFVEQIDSIADKVQIIGFSKQVDIVSEFSSNKEYLETIVSEFEPTESTAFLDALEYSLNQFQNRKGFNVVIALTDGKENASKTTDSAVVEKAKLLKIPIFVVGFGDVNQSFLEHIARETNGAFYYTDNSNSLSTIYLEIQKRIKSIYDLRYESTNLSSNDSLRKLRIEFDIDSIYLMNNLVDLKIPAETIQYIESKRRKERYRITGYVVTGTILSAGILLFVFRRRKKLFGLRRK